MTLSELCIRRPVLTTLITASMLVFGFFAYRLLPVAALPTVDYPTIAITATLPGADNRHLPATAHVHMASSAAPWTRLLELLAEADRNVESGGAISLRP